MQYTPYASSVDSSESQVAGMLSSEGEDGGKSSPLDASADIPASSSTLIPSSPFIGSSRNASQKSSQSNDASVHSDHKSRIYAYHPDDGGSSIACDELEQWFTSQADEHGPTCGDSPGSAGCTGDKNDCTDSEYDETYSRCLNTREAQNKFSERLTKLLLRVADEDEDADSSCHSQSTPAVASARIHAPRDLDSSSRPVLESANSSFASAAVYSADISGFASSASASASSWSVSACSDASSTLR